MKSISSPGRLAALVLAALLLCKSPAAALDLFATHQVTVQFAAADGKPMADADVNVYAPGDPTHVVKTGKTDKDGKFEFGTDRDGLWTAEARAAGEVARATLRVGSDQPSEPVSPYWLFGGLFVLLIIAVGYRFLRLRARGRRPRS
jgi:hypothetical protein